MDSTALPPTGLLCQLLAMPEKTVIQTARPRFGWVVNDTSSNATQTAYRILVAAAAENLSRHTGDVWDSGKCLSSSSIQIPYAGPALTCDTDYFWTVCTWNQHDQQSEWANPQHFRTGALTGEYSTERYPLEKTPIEPAALIQKAPGHYFIDFGKAAFGTVQLELTSAIDQHAVEVHLGEALTDKHTIDRTPQGCIRYRTMTVPLKKGTHWYTVEIPPDPRNTASRTIRMPQAVGEVLPFRYCELVHVPAAAEPPRVRQMSVHYPFDETASRFNSSNAVLNDVWELCKYSIKATSFAGVYVDGDRERIPYEADAYINQLCHYAVDREFSLARYSHEFLITHPTTPTEWLLHSVLLAWADYNYTGNADSLAHFYSDLKAKMLLPLARNDGLISTQTGLLTDEVYQSVYCDEAVKAVHAEIKDLVDWPPASFTKGNYGERDNYEFVPINTVVNAFHYRALTLMAKIAAVLDNTDEARYFSACDQRVYQAFNAKLFDCGRGVYLDGEGAAHASLHANMFPLAFDLVPQEHQRSVLNFVKARGMACSVYGAQYLLEALYRCHEADYAFELMTAQTDRSWWNMLQVGSTVTLEAWDWKYKNNLDWNHAWGAAPANIIPRYLMGVRPLEPGFAKTLIHPQPGPLLQAQITVPTIRGPIQIQWHRRPDQSLSLQITLPANMTARVLVTLAGLDHPEVLLDGAVISPEKIGAFAAVDPLGSGTHTLQARSKL